MRVNRKGPLAGLRVIEFEGLGPTPFAAMMLADMGAEVVRIARPAPAAQPPGDAKLDALARSRRSVQLDLKQAIDRATALRLVAMADILIEGHRPGVMERLELGPAVCHAANPRPIYARLTGWGQTGQLAARAGHDINYVAQAGALYPIGPADAPPPPPLNLVGDFGGGGVLAVAGILAALYSRGERGTGQVIDSAMVDGVALLSAQLHAWRAMGFWTDRRGENLLDGGAYFYRCYETADGQYMAVGAIEPQFHAAMLRGLDLDPAQFPNQLDRRFWSERSILLAGRFAQRSRAEWVVAFADLDACVSPVLTPMEATLDPDNRARNLFVSVDGHPQPAPAPRFSGDSRSLQAEGAHPTSAPDDIIDEWRTARENPTSPQS